MSAYQIKSFTGLKLLSNVSDNKIRTSGNSDSFFPKFDQLNDLEPANLNKHLVEQLVQVSFRVICINVSTFQSESLDLLVNKIIVINKLQLETYFENRVKI